MVTISVNNLTKHFSVYKKEPGLMGSIKSLVNRKYETVKAVEDISFQIEEGELVGFIGPNGAGKTTTLKSLSGLLYPTSGKLSVLGFTPFDRKKEFLKQISLVMGQKNQLWWDLPAMETLLLNKEIYEIKDDRFKEVVEDLTKLLDTKDILHIPVRKLSLGQRMKMELIASLIHSPKVMFLDEPTIGLDVVMQKNIREFLKEYNKKYNATIILTSHYMGDVEKLCKRVIVINYGKLIYDGELSDLVRDYAPHKFIKVIFNKEINKKEVQKFGKVYKFEYPELVLSVKREDTNRVAAQILENFSVEDINIEDPEIEGVIQDVFTKKKK